MYCPLSYIKHVRKSAKTPNKHILMQWSAIRMLTKMPDLLPFSKDLVGIEKNRLTSWDKY